DGNGVGIDNDSIIDGDAEFLLSGNALGNVVVNGHPTRPDASNPNLYRYSFTGSFSLPTSPDPLDPYNTIQIAFLPQTFQDRGRSNNNASVQQFTLAADTAGTSVTVPLATLAAPFTGQTVSLQSLLTRPYIDVTFTGIKPGGTLTGIDGDEILLRARRRPLSIAGPSVSLVDTKFKDGKLNLTVGLGADSASLAFGGTNGQQTAGQSSNGITATLTGILVTFDVQVDVMQAVQALQNPS